MAVYAIADLHLSLNGEKPMDIFPGWEDYINRISKNFNETLKEEDTLIIAGDFSWGMSLEDGILDFQFLDNFPGKKILLKGNHDYYWDTLTKMNNFFRKNKLDSLSILHNNAYEVEDFAVCGTRGWVNDSNTEKENIKVVLREAGRLERSILMAKKISKPIRCFLHYPPAYKNAVSQEILDVLIRNEIKCCYYGHIHGSGKNHAIEGNYNGIEFKLISADYLDFTPLKII